MATCTTTRAPGPRGNWLLGSLQEFRRDSIGLLMRVAEEYGDIVRLRFGPITAHLINHPEFVGQVLEERYQRYDKRTRSVSKMRATCGASLLTEDGPAWLRHRQLVQPALLRHSVERYVPIVTAETATMVQRWREAAQQGRPLDIVSEMMQLTLTIASRVLFGADISGDTKRIESSLAEILADTWRRVESVVDFSRVSPAFHRSKFLKAVRDIDDVVYRIIGSRQQRNEPRSDLLDALLDSRSGLFTAQPQAPARSDNGNDPPRAGACGWAVNEGGLSDQELRDATITMLLAGHETTANALAWTFSLVFRSPAVEQRLVSEANRVLQTRHPVAADLDRLEFAGQSFAEAIRLYPSIWIMERRVVSDDEIGGYAIPANSMLLISPYVLHRHARYWPDAERFDPDRFSPTQCEQRPKNTYIPFGAGPHQCIGRFMAPMVAKLVVAMVVQNFRLTPLTPEIAPPVPGITLRHGDGLKMLVEARESAGWTSGRSGSTEAHSDGQSAHSTMREWPGLDTEE